MAIKKHSKLVRDKIPEIIAASGVQVGVERLDDTQFPIALRQKLVEEAHEAQQAEIGDLCVEIADLQEVIDALLTFHGFTRDDVAAIQEKRRAERGAFEKRLWLDWTEESAG